MVNYDILLHATPIMFGDKYNEKETSMENLPTWLVIILSIIGAIGGGAGILAWVRFPQEKKKVEADTYKTLSETVSELSETVKNQGEEMEKIKAKNNELEIKVEELEDENKILLRGVTRLVNQIRKAGLEPVWTPDTGNDIIENKKE